MQRVAIASMYGGLLILDRTRKINKMLIIDFCVSLSCRKKIFKFAQLTNTERCAYIGHIILKPHHDRLRKSKLVTLAISPPRFIVESVQTHDFKLIRKFLRVSSNHAAINGRNILVGIKTKTCDRSFESSNHGVF